VGTGLALICSNPSQPFEVRIETLEASMLNQEVRDEKSTFDMFPGGDRWRVGPGRSGAGRTGTAGSAGAPVRAGTGASAEVL
jgi:hypothetical protein